MATYKKKLYGTRLDKIQEELDNQVHVVEVDGKKVSNNQSNKYIDLAPIRKTTNSSAKTNTTKTIKNTEKDISWFKSGAFSDGYDFGDLTKTILGTTTDLTQDLVKGALNIGESALDLGTYGVSAVADKLGFDDVAEDTKKFGQRNLIEETGIANRMAQNTTTGIINNIVQGNWDSLNPFNTKKYIESTGSDTPFENSSVLGEKSDQVGQGIGYVAGMTGLQMIGVPWQVTSMVTSMGSEMTEAFDNNATYGQAFASGIMSGLVEMGSEYLFGGLGKVTGAGALDDLFAGNAGKLVSKLTNSQALKNVTEAIVKAGGEGVEEILSGYGSAIGKKLTYMSDKEINEIYSSDQAFDDFINGALVSGFIQAPGTVQTTKQGRDYVSGYTQNEQTVIDSLVNEQVNEIAKYNALENELNKAIESKETEQGGILSDKEKNALKSKIEAQIANGELDISSTKVSNKDINKIREAVEESMKKGLLDTNTIESVLGTGTDLSKDSYLQKSYIETAKRREAFTYENEITDAKEKAVYDSATKYFNNTTRSHEFVERVAKISKEKGTNYGFINNEELQSLGHDVEGKQVNGLVRTNKNGEQTVLINIDSPKALETIVGHETTHLLEGTQEYQDLQEAIFNYAKEKGDFDARQKSLNSLYEGIENANVDSELTADLVGDYLFTDTNFINSISTEKPTLFQKIKELIDDLVVRFTGTKEEKALREVQKKFKKAYRNSTTQTDTDTDTKYSVSKVSKQYLEKQFEKLTGDSILRADAVLGGIELRNNMRQEGNRTDAVENIPYSDEAMEIYNTYKNSRKSSNYLYHTTSKENLQSILANGLTTNNKARQEGVSGTGKLYLAANEQLASSFGEDTDILLRIDPKHNLENLDSDLLGGEGTYSTTNNIPVNALQVKENGKWVKLENSQLAKQNIQYSLTDNQGRTLTKEQQEYFKDSKVVDNEGRLKEVYHGTGTTIDEFKTEFTGKGNDQYGSGFYFTDNAEDAEGYKTSINTNTTEKLGGTDNPNVVKSYLNITKPIIADGSNLSNSNIEITHKQTVEIIKKAPNLYDVDESPIGNWHDVWSEGVQDYMIEDVATHYEGDLLSLENDFFRENATEFRQAVYDATGYDGVIHTYGNGTTHYIAWFPNQIKSVDNANPTAEDPNIFRSLSQQNEAAPTKNPNLTYSEDIKLQVEEAIAPLQEQINELTEQITNNTTDNVKVPEMPNMEELAPITEVEYTQPTKAELDNLMSLQKTGGTEYANTFFGLRDKYGQRNLYKGIEQYKKAPNTYEAPIKGDEFAPIPQDIVEQQGQEAFNNIDESSMPGEIEDTTPDVENEVTDTKSLFETRNYEDVGNRKVNAYQYDNPEVKPYFQEAAQQMLYDLDNSIKGERMYNDEAYYNSNGEIGWYGTARQTTTDIAELLDGIDGKYKLSYENIRKGLNAIIKDEGSENNAASKRIEFYLDQRLRQGYTSVDGFDVPANQEYIDMMAANELTDTYNNIPITDDLAPVENVDNIVDNVSNSESIAPVNEQYEAIRPEPRMIRVKEPQKLGEVEGRVTKPTEPELINGAKQQTFEGFEEDLYTKTKKELRRDLIEPNKEFLISALDNAKNRSMAFMNNTDTIRNTELVFGREAGKMINDTIFQKEIDNEADSIAWQNKERQEIKDLGIKARSKESAAVQKYGEKQWVNEAGEVMKYGDTELAAEFTDVATQQKIKIAAKELRAKYDYYIYEANKVLTKLGFEPIKKRNDYMRHFQELNDVFTRYGIPFNAQNMQEHVLPTDINGLTEFWSPQKNYFANMQPRKGIKTTYDAITGIDGYISGISNLIFHTEDIQRGRAFEELIRETYGESKGWENLEKLPDELKQARAEKIQDNHLSNYAAWLHEWTNNIAGKKSKIDRSIESMFGRKVFSFLDNVRKQVGSNMVGGNVSSAGTNFISSFQAMAKTNKLAVAKGTADTIKNIFIKDNFIDNNKFLTSRMGTDMISKNAWQKIQDAGYVFMKGSDWFTSNQIVRSKYYELRAKGMSEQQAHTEAGQFAARIMSDRTKGAAPQIYNSKMLGLITQFQQEVNNQLYSTFYDTYHESKENAQGNALKTAAGMTFTLGQLFAFTHLFGKTFESIAGYNPTFDVVEIIKTAFGWGDEEDEEKTTSERLKEAADMLVDALPYVNILTGGGRIPVASGIPNLIGVATGGTDDYGNELTLEDELKKLLYLIPPTGGNQIKKTYQGLSMFDEDLPVTGSYTDSGNLRFPVEDTLGNRIQAGLFGQYASENAQTYFDEERSPLKEKQIQEYADLDLPIREYWDYRDGLKGLNTLEEKFEYINDLDVTDEQKNIMINNIVDRKEEVDMSNYDDYGSYEEFDFAIKNEEKYNFLQENNISYSDYVENEHSKEAYNWAYNNPEKYKVSKAVTDNVVAYRQYKNDIYDIAADKDENGDSIRGSRKEKVFNYINKLKLSIPQKAILFRQEYPSDNTYNAEIVSYVDSLDISYKEKVTIVEELDMTVDENGNIYWD